MYSEKKVQKMKMGSKVFLYNGSGKVPRDVTHVRVDSSVTEIPDKAFQFCRGVVSVQLNEGLVRIGNYAFCCCRSLVNINFPSTLKVIGDYAFGDCGSLITAKLNEGLLNLQSEAFIRCYSLKYVIFPSTLQSIGGSAFYSCKNLLRAHLPNGLEEVGHLAFSHCASLRVLVVPSSVKTIERLCGGCLNLRTLELHEGLETIGYYTFYKCESLKRVMIPSTVKRIQQTAFGSCTNLISIELPEGLEELGDGAFAGCEAMRNLVIPSSIVKYGRIFTPEYYNSSIPHRLKWHIIDNDRNETHLTNILKTRFHALPIHQLCYHQAHYSTRAVLEKLEDAIKFKSVPSNDKDVFGMTPFHILALSVKPNVDLLKALLKHYPNNIASSKDESGSCAIDYLISKVDDTPESDTMIKQLLNPILEDRIKKLGLGEWQQSVIAETTNFPEAWNGVVERKRQLKTIYSTLAKYERLEALSILEECIWSMKMDENKDSDRQSCRITSGVEVVISKVLPFLDDSDSFLYDTEGHFWSDSEVEVESFNSDDEEDSSDSEEER